MNKTEKEWAVGMLFMGVILGIIGSLAANVLDRQFVERFGTWYDVVVALFFFILIWWLERKFTKLLDKNDSK